MRNRSLLCLVSFIFIVSFAWDVRAQPQFPTETSSLEYGLIFHKMMNSPPDFEKWAEIYTHGKQKDLGPAGRESFKRGIKRTFQNDYAHMVPEDEIIIMNAPARMEVVPISPHDPHTGYYMLISLEEKFSFFAMEIPEYNLAFIINDLQQSLEHKISYDDFQILERQADVSNLAKQNPVILTFTLKPARVEKKGPVQVKGRYYWGLYADLIRLEVRDINNGRKIWQYVHLPEYDDRQKKLRSLYLRGYTEPSENGNEIPKLF